jgi:MYXO-CTERM domain-containing protein
MRLSALSLLVVVLLSHPVLAQETYVRDDAPDGGDGLTWSTALNELPHTTDFSGNWISSFERGRTYYIADGSYRSIKIGDPDDGDQFITLRKATVADHGSDDGWDNSYGDGQAVWGIPVKIAANRIIFDGVEGGGPGSWTSGHGFRMDVPSDTSIQAMQLSDKGGAPSQRVDVDRVTISHVEFAGETPVVPGSDEGVNATAQDAEVSNLTIAYCYFHDIGSVHIKLANTTDVLVEYNYLARNASSPEHHGQGVRTDNVQRAVFRYNVHVDFTGTGFLGFYSPSHRDIDIYGSIFHRTVGSDLGVGNGVITNTASDGTSLENIRVHNNTFVNHEAGNVINFHDPASGETTTENVQVYNNLLFDLGATPAFGRVTDRDHNWFGQPGGTFDEPHGQDGGSSDPLVDWQGGDFGLVAATEAGMDLSDLAGFNDTTPQFHLDMFGNERGLDGLWDRGAIEFGVGGTGGDDPSVGGGGASQGGGGAGPGGAGTSAGGEEESGCGCAAVGRRPSVPGGWFALFALAGLARIQRRKHGH